MVHKSVLTLDDYVNWLMWQMWSHFSGSQSVSKIYTLSYLDSSEVTDNFQVYGGGREMFGN